MKPQPRLTVGGVALAVVLGAILIAALIGTLGAFAVPDGMRMNGHGWAALSIGVILSLALGGGLMALVFYSARKGYDDRIAPDPAAPDDDPGERD